MIGRSVPRLTAALALAAALHLAAAPAAAARPAAAPEPGAPALRAAWGWLGWLSEKVVAVLAAAPRAAWQRTVGTAPGDLPGAQEDEGSGIDPGGTANADDDKGMGIDPNG
jgi:hypothetical protein